MAAKIAIQITGIGAFYYRRSECNHTVKLIENETVPDGTPTVFSTRPLRSNLAPRYVILPYGHPLTTGEKL